VGADEGAQSHALRRTRRVAFLFVRGGADGETRGATQVMKIVKAIKEGRYKPAPPKKTEQV
jgi:hypothetical protein